MQVVLKTTEEDEEMCAKKRWQCAYLLLNRAQVVALLLLVLARVKLTIAAAARHLVSPPEYNSLSYHLISCFVLFKVSPFQMFTMGSQLYW